MNQIRSLLGLLLIALLAGCASLAPPQGRIGSTALTGTAATTLGRDVDPGVQANPGKTGIHSLRNPRDAFAARIALADSAQVSLDAQYYIWHADQAGGLMTEALWKAAERGVRVRLLLDDLNTQGMDATIAALASHPNFEVRLYNPLVYRDARALNFVTEFTRVNHRMHNKSFTADNQVSVVGGRNIGNEYFGAGDGVIFADLDVIAIGAAVRDVSAAFDLFWNSASAYPAAPFVGRPESDPKAMLAAMFNGVRNDPASIAYLEAVRATPLLRDLGSRNLQFEWTTATLLHDDPAKTLDTENRTDVQLFPVLLRTMGHAGKALDLVSPYFVPGAAGTAMLATIAKGGVKVRVLTNSLAAIDEGWVYAGYAKRRKALLEAGIQLFELKPTREKQLDTGLSRFGRSAEAALHAKTMAIDGSRVFIGSFNLDPRSSRLNTEMGLVIDSRSLAGLVGKTFDTEVPNAAYEVRLANDGQSLEWIERTADGERRFDVDPGTSVLLRLGVGVMSLLPIEWLL